MKRRSFAMTGELEAKLAEISRLKGCSTQAEAMRLSIEHTHETLLFKPKPELISLVESNAALLRFLIIEVVKIHGGNVRLDETTGNYLKSLNSEISEYLQASRVVK